MRSFGPALHDIALVNRLTFSDRPTLTWLKEVVATHPVSSGPLRVMDVGCGYGDTLRLIHGLGRETQYSSRTDGYRI